MSRREAMGVIAATAGAFLVPRPAQATAAIQMATTRRREAESAGVAFAPKVYTAHEWATLQLLVNYVIPQDATSGSATDAGVPEFMDTMLDLEPGMRTANRGGLAWVDHQCHRLFDRDFVDCTDGQRRQVLDAIAYPKRASADMTPGVSWFNAFRDFTATGFFTSEMGVKDLGYIGNTAVPEWTGCPAENYQRLGVSP
ncbi:MAG: gluconate 2-dehydrogenase subunit 3 family protein [Gemmatimonadales bacterium]